MYGAPSFLPMPEPSPHPRPAPIQEDPTEPEFKFINDILDENLQIGDEWVEGSWDPAEEDDIDAEDDIQPTLR